MTTRSPLIIIRSQYFLYFSVMGVVLPYFNLYCYHIGFSGYQIGVLSALRSFAIVLFPILWGMLADRFHIRKPIYVVCNFIATVIWLGYFFTTDFGPMMLITLAFGIFYTPIIALLEATTMDALAGEKPRYGQTRAWGSIGFILMVLVLGRVIDSAGISIILALALAGSAIQAVLATQLPSGQTRQPNPQSDTSLSGIWALFTGRFTAFLVCAFLMLVSHGAYYGFFSIHLEKLGFSGMFIGAAWALASTAEILVMLASARLFRRFSPENMMLFSFGAAILRWLILFWAISPVIIMLSQVLHAVTYGLFHMASIIYVDKLSSKESKNLGQAVNNSVTYGLGLMTGFYFNGWLYEHVSVFVLFLFSAGVAVIGGIVAHRWVHLPKPDPETSINHF
jgi:PPP family 3-phenylpropionic acid transporter